MENSQMSLNKEELIQELEKVLDKLEETSNLLIESEESETFDPFSEEYLKHLNEQDNLLEKSSKIRKKLEEWWDLNG